MASVNGTITSSYYRGASAIIVMFHVHDRVSWHRVRSHWIPEIERYAAETACVVLLGLLSPSPPPMTSDDASNQTTTAIPREEIDAFVDEYILPYYPRLTHTF